MERLSILMEDDSSVALRLSLIALKSCVVDILNSYHSYVGIKVRTKIFLYSRIDYIDIKKPFRILVTL